MARAMKDSGIEWIGEIPSDWKSYKLKYLGQYINGYAFKPEDWGNIGKKIIRIQDLTGSIDKPNFFAGEIDKRYLVKNGDILVSWAATLEAFVWANGDGWLNQHIFKAVPCEKLVDYTYFFWLIKEAMKNMNNDNKHGIVMQHVTLDVFNNFTVPLPPKYEQQRIADFLDHKCAEIDAVLEKTRASIEDYKKLKQSIITEAVTKGVRGPRPMKPSGIAWIGDIPADWEVTRFKSIASIKSNLVTPNEYGNYPQISPENIEKGTGKLLHCQTVSEVGVISGNHLFYQGQILYSKIRPKLNKITIAPFDGLCSADMYPIEAFENQKYLLYAMLSDELLSQVSMITEDRVKMPKINQIELGNTWFARPPKVEQCEIADYLDEKCKAIDLLISQKTKLLEEMETYKKSMIYEYVTGKKEVAQ